MEDMSRTRTSGVLAGGFLILWACATPEPALPEPDWSAFPQATVNTVRAAHQAAEEDPRDVGALGETAMYLHAFDQSGLAARYYSLAATAAPADPRWAYLEGVALQAAGEPERAEAALRRALRLQPGALEARLRLADILTERGAPEEAEELYRSVLAADPQSAVARYGLGRVASEAGDTASAIIEFQKACTLAPSYSAARYALALALRESGDEEGARTQLDLFERRPKVNATFADPLVGQVNALRVGTAPGHLVRGRQLADQGRVDEAIAEYQKALDADPQFADAHVNLLSAYGSLGDLDRAQEHYEKAVALGADQPELYYNYGSLQASLGNFREAVSWFDKALEGDPGLADALVNAGYCLERTGQRRAAVARFAEALRIDPYHRTGLYHMARHDMLRGQPAQAAERLARAAEQDDSLSARYLIPLSEAHEAAGDRTAARASLERAGALGQALGLEDVSEAARARLGQLR